MAAIGTRKLQIEIDGTEYTAEVSNVRVVAGESDSDFVTFADAAAGGSREYRLAITLAQDAAASSLWSEIFDNAGTTVPFTIMPYGNAVASATEPHFTGSCVISEPDGDLLGGEANASPSARFTVEVEWVCTAKPARVAA
jgi:hypothetical protein